MFFHFMTNYKNYFCASMKILFTCLGNICRSPIAEAILKERVQQHDLPWTVASNGTNRYHKGDPADPRTVKVCLKYGIDIRRHVARRFKTSDFELYDLIICMANDVYQELQEFVTDPEQLEKVIVQPFDDPWYGGEAGFDRCFHEIQAYCERLILEKKGTGI
jgi:protein-tyrosine phosphatase